MLVLSSMDAAAQVVFGPLLKELATASDEPALIQTLVTVCKLLGDIGTASTNAAVMGVSKVNALLTLALKNSIHTVLWHDEDDGRNSSLALQCAEELLALQATRQPNMVNACLERLVVGIATPGALGDMVASEGGLAAAAPVLQALNAAAVVPGALKLVAGLLAKFGTAAAVDDFDVQHAMKAFLMHMLLACTQ